MNSMIIAVAGGTGSGKSYLAKNLANSYPKKKILIIEQDSYYKDISNLDYEDRCKQNFDQLEHMDNLQASCIHSEHSAHSTSGTQNNYFASHQA